MSLGVEEDVIYHIPNEESRTDTYLREEFVRVTDHIKELGGVPQINHPCDHSKSISWNKEYNDLLPIFQTMEIWNGSNPMLLGSTNYKAFQLWQGLLEKGQFIPATAGSDTHNILANDYHVLFEKFKWLIDLIINKRIEIPDRLIKEVDFLIKMNKEVIPLLEKWANTNLTSAGVRTFVHVNGCVTQEKILDGLKCGHSFLTNGPVLIPEISKRIPGETATKESSMVDIKVTLFGNRPLKQLSIYANGMQINHIPLETTKSINGKYDYSRIISSVSVKDVKWLFFIATDDCTNMAITNPIFLN